MDIKGKQVLITGGSSGIGFQCVKVFMEYGAKRVFIVDIDQGKADDYIERQTTKSEKNRIEFHRCDVSRPKEFKSVFDAIVKRHGAVHILLNNAAIFRDRDWEETIQTNLVGTLSCMLTFMEHTRDYLKGERGVILNNSSISGIKPLYGCPVYSSTKSAIVSLTRSFSVPYYEKEFNVRVMVICPSLVFTEMGNELEHKFLSPGIRDEWFKIVKGIPMACPRFVAKEMAKMVLYGKNGAIWTVEGDSPSLNVTLLSEKSKL